MADTRIPYFCKLDGATLIFNADGELRFYVPENYFNGKNAEIIGDKVSLMGIFNYSLFDKNGKNNGLKTFKLQQYFYLNLVKLLNLKKSRLLKNKALQILEYFIIVKEMLSL